MPSTRALHGFLTIQFLNIFISPFNFIYYIHFAYVIYNILLLRLVNNFVLHSHHLLDFCESSHFRPAIFVYVEDPAVVTRSCAIIANPGAASRNGEKNEILPAIKKFYPEDRIHFITGEGHLDGGDVMMVGDHFYVGRSARTNEEGIRQFSEILAKYGMTCSEVTLEKVLHLKTGVNYIENNNMLVSGEFVTKPEFEKYNKILIPEGEEYAANCIWMNGNVIVPEGYPGVAKLVEEAGYRAILCDTSEFRKLDGGLSCMSLRF